MIKTYNSNMSFFSANINVHLRVWLWFSNTSGRKMICFYNFTFCREVRCFLIQYFFCAVLNFFPTLMLLCEVSNTKFSLVIISILFRKRAYLWSYMKFEIVNLLKQWLNRELCVNLHQPYCRLSHYWCYFYKSCAIGFVYPPF